MTLALIVFFTTWAIAAMIMNHRNTGDILKILPGQEKRFWRLTLGISGIITAVYILF